MATKQIAWQTGSGNITLTYQGQGDGTISISSDPNSLYEARSKTITVKTTDGSNIQRTVTIQQAAKVRIDISTAVVTASNQTYNGSAKTPIPTVTLNGEIIPSSGYDVAYNDNINAGTATITITGKGDYTGTATGTFTIAKANPTYTAPTARTGLTYSGSSQYLVTAGSTSHGTIQYSSNGTTWSTTRPSSTNAGSYTTYWKLVGDSNHNDVASTSLSTTIDKASRTLSFADAYVVLNTSSNVTKTATPSAGSGDGTITYSISSTIYATINSSSGKVTSKTSDGSATVTATIAEGTNYLSASTSYTLYVFATTHDFDYTGSVQNVTLPPGSYKLQCWGAQGGNITNSVNGAKGGYSEGVLTISQQQTLYAFVGGQGRSANISAGGGMQNGGWNGGGGAPVFTSYSSSSITGTNAPRPGGGATDFSTVTSPMSYSSYRNNRTSASLNARLIVAGGGAGASACDGSFITIEKRWVTKGSVSASTSGASGDVMGNTAIVNYSHGTYYVLDVLFDGLPFSSGDKIRVTLSPGNDAARVGVVSSYSYGASYVTSKYFEGTTGIYTIPSSGSYLRLTFTSISNYWSGTITFEREEDVEVTSTYGGISDGTQVGGGTSGGGTNPGTQSGGGGELGKGANMSSTTALYASGGGGGGYYGGGASYDNSTRNKINQSGGGSGYTGSLTSAQTKAGNTSFPSTSGGNETGHAGNGYARITRLS